MKRKFFPRPGRHIDLAGQRRGHLLIVEKVGSNGGSLWKVRCDCGKEVVNIAKELRRAQFCGHECPLFKKRIARATTTHGMSSHPAFGVWHSMKQRCNDKNHSAFKNYGARGIAVCPEWDASFEAFWQDMGATWVKGLDLDRIDNNAGYSKANCRWTTRRQNCDNRRKSTTTAELRDLAKANGVPLSTLYFRLNKGISAEEAVKR